MMDLKEIIKWFIPCFHILLLKNYKMNAHLTWICLFLLFNSRPSYGANVNNSIEISDTKNVVELNYLDNNKYNQSEVDDIQLENEDRSLDTSKGRTFGRPLKKMMQALIPLAFQIGAASSWAVVAALVGVKTLGVALVILKLLLIAGAVKLGAIFGQKSHAGHENHGGWETPHQKEIHLHIHNGQHGATEEHYPISSWNRDGNPVAISDTGNVNYVVNPYVTGPQTIQYASGPQTIPLAEGPQTIHTPYGSYVKIDPPNTVRK